MAHLTIYGQLDSSPSILSTAGGRKVAQLSVVERLQWRGGDGSLHKGEALYHRVLVFGDDAERSMRLRKGDTVLIEGNSQAETYINEDGEEVPQGITVSASHIGISLSSY